jgi:acyl carrier protein
MPLVLRPASPDGGPAHIPGVQDCGPAEASYSHDVEAQVRAELIDFVVTNFLFGDTTRTPQDDDSLVEGGIIDSTGVMELIEFLESTFGIEVSESDTVPSNLDAVGNLTRFVLRTQAAAHGTRGAEDRHTG